MTALDPIDRAGVSVGVLLAGGESRRMGQDKRALRLGDRSLIERNVAFLRSLFPTVAVSVRDRAQFDAALGASAQDRATGAADGPPATDDETGAPTGPPTGAAPPAGVEVLCDERPGSPLGGIATALRRYEAPIFALAADIAFADPEAVATVLAAFRHTDVALPIVGGHLEPLHAVYGAGCLPVIRSLLDSGRHSILDLFPEVRVVTVPFHSAHPFFNVNTPEDWAEARRRDDACPDERSSSRPTT